MSDQQIGNLLILLEANTAKLDEQIKQSKQNMLDFKGSLDVVKDALIALGAFEVFDKVITASADAQKAQALLASQIKATGDASGYTQEQLTAMAESFSHSSTSSKEQVEQLEAELMAFRNIAGDQFKGAIQAALDFSAVTGRDATMAIKSLGMALNDPVTGMTKLSKAGIDLTEQVKATVKALAEQGDLMGAQNLLLEQMEKSYGGAAAAARDTLGGALAGLKNDFNELLADNSTPQLTQSIKDLSQTLQDPNIKQGIASLVAGMATLVSWVVQAAAHIADLSKGIGELFAGAVMGAGNDSLTGMISNLKVEITSLQDQIKRANDENGDEGLLGKWLAPNTGKLQARLDQAKLELQGLINLQQTADNQAPASKPLQGGQLDALETPDLGALKSLQSVHEMSTGNFSGLKSSYDQLLSDQKEIIAIWKQNDPAAYLQQQIDKTQELVNTDVNGTLFTADDAQKQIEKLRFEYAKSTDAMTQASQSAAQGIQSDFQQFLFDPFQEGLGGLAKAFEQTLLKMLAQAEAAQLFKALFGANDPTGQGSGTTGLGVAIGNFFAGHRAGGGPVQGGMLYQVNEGGSGTEAFVPGSGGSIVPLGAGAGGHGGDINTSLHFDLRGGGGDSGANFLSALPAIRRVFQSDVEYRIARGTWPG